jgi:hypothetical protein
VCFSAEASFTGSAVMSAIGVASLTRVKKPAQVLFAVIPLLFGIQQCAEGMLWLTLKSGLHERLQYAATYIFLITALVIWPTMIPLSARLMEKSKPRKKVLTGLMITGAVLSLSYAFCLLFYDVTPQIHGFHIRYVDDFPGVFVKIAFVLYLAVTIVPFFISSVKRMWFFGVLIAVSCIITGIFFAQYLTSVWCFFAACISIVVFRILSGMKSETVQMPGRQQPWYERFKKEHRHPGEKFTTQ